MIVFVEAVRQQVYPVVRSAQYVGGDTHDCEHDDYAEIIGDARPWQAVLDPSALHDDIVAAGHRLADAAKAGDWPTVMRVLDGERHWLVTYHQAVGASDGRID